MHSGRQDLRMKHDAAGGFPGTRGARRANERALARDAFRLAR
jgi:hypothetical protein